MTAINTGRLSEQAYTQVLPCGLTVFAVKKPGFRKKAGLLAVRYGSDDILLPGSAETPAGVAHFLEHKMFDMPDGRNVLQIYGELGASPNASTSHSHTAYYFETTQRFDQCLSLLLEYVFTPYYTKESVDKEQGIIGQELSMYRDMPQMRLFEELLALTYTKLPVRLPIGGTHESIARITAQTLYDCHRSFYTPSNMTLCVAGDIEPEDAARLAQELAPSGMGDAFESRALEEPDEAGGRELTLNMDVPLPLFGIAVKLKPPAGLDRLAWQTRIRLAAECLAGMSSPLYSKLYEDGLIDSGFGFDPFLFRHGGCLLFIGQSRDPQAVRDALLEQARTLVSGGAPEQLFRRVKRSSWGARVRVLDSTTGLCHQVAVQHLSGGNFFGLPEIYDAAGQEQVSEIWAQITEERTAMVTIRS